MEEETIQATQQCNDSNEARSSHEEVCDKMATSNSKHTMVERLIDESDSEDEETKVDADIQRIKSSAESFANPKGTEDDMESILKTPEFGKNIINQMKQMGLNPGNQSDMWKFLSSQLGGSNFGDNNFASMGGKQFVTHREKLQHRLKMKLNEKSTIRRKKDMLQSIAKKTAEAKEKANAQATLTATRRAKRNQKRRERRKRNRAQGNADTVNNETGDKADDDEIPEITKGDFLDNAEN
jgi:hypothetical protein